jgi:flavodoxin
MKALVVYYSLDGSTARVAEWVQKYLGADALALKLADRRQRQGLFKLLWGVAMVLGKKQPPLMPYEADLSPYDLIVLGTPVWASIPAPPLATFLAQTPVTGKKVAVFCCHGGGKGTALETLKAMLPGNTIVGEADFANVPGTEAAILEARVSMWAERLAVLMTAIEASEEHE